MASSVFFERGASQAMTMGWQPNGMTNAMPAANNWCVLPRCEMRFEKCAGGMKIHCYCEDEVSCGTMQNLCKMLCEGMCSCCVTCNGMPVCQYNLTMGTCVCELTKNGVCISCTSGDEACCAMLQACCDCLACMCENNCCCYVCFGNTPVCCGKC